MVAAGRMRRGSAASVCRSFATGCCASTPADRTGWSMGSHRAHPRSSTPITAAHWRRLLRPARSRPTASCAGGARTWRGGSWNVRHLARRAVGRELKALGFAKISARPRTRKTSWPSRLLKKTSPPWRIRARLPKGVEIELWWQDEARSARRISSHADGPDVARARGRPATSAPNGPISSARSVPRRGKAPGWSCPGATPTPWRRTSSRSVPPSIPAPMRC